MSVDCTICGVPLSDADPGMACIACRSLAEIGRKVLFEIEKLEIKRDKDEPLSDAEDEWLNDLQTLVAGRMETEEK